MDARSDSLHHVPGVNLSGNYSGRRLVGARYTVPLLFLDRESLVSLTEKVVAPAHTISGLASGMPSR